MSEEANNPAEAEAPAQELAPDVETEGAEAQTDEGTVNDGDPEPEEGDGEGGETPDDHEEIEIDGETYIVPPKLAKELKEGVLRQQDYTRKTQEVAETRKAVETERQALEQQRAQQAEVFTALRAEVVKVGAIESQLAEYKNVDWRALQTQIASIADPTEQNKAIAQYNLAWNAFTALEREYDQAKQTLSAREQELSTAQTQRVQAAVRDALQSIQKEDATFNVEKAQAAVKHAMDNFGLTDEEAHQIGDKRIWKLMLSDKAKTDRISALEAENKRLKGHRAAETANKAAQQVRPAAQVKGAASANTNPRDTDPIDVWMKKERARMERKAARG